jgi:NhaP-type Na+/H+ or K+/H+ antiporter
VELTLALVLFTDAAHADLGELRRSFRMPQRLLVLSLPLTIILGIVFALLMFDHLTFFEAAILATILAPTDAALGKAVITNKQVPVEIRECLNAESGFNDGLCVPILLVFLALATGSSGDGGNVGFALLLFVEEVGIGMVVGVGLTLAGGWLLRYCAEREWITETWRQLPVSALAIACFAVAQSIGGSGFIAAFVGGILFGALAKKQKHKLLVATESNSDTLALITWVFFGATVIGHLSEYINWMAFLYALLSLTVIRMLPVFLSLAGLGMDAKSKLFIGWFGPRGLASIVFGIIVLNEALPGGETLTLVVVYTVVLSVIAHGLTANPLAGALGKALARADDG